MTAHSKLGADFVVWIGVITLYYVAAAITGWLFCSTRQAELNELFFLFCLTIIYVVAGTRILVAGIALLWERYLTSLS